MIRYYIHVSFTYTLCPEKETKMFLTSLHYLVKLEIPIVHMLPLSYDVMTERNFRIYSTSAVSSKFANLNLACEKYCKRRCTKHASLIWSC